MVIYSSTKNRFLDSVKNGTIADEISGAVREKMRRRTGDSEYRSWMNSMQHMSAVLSDQSIPADAGVAIEYNIPHTSKRVDFIVTGIGGEGRPCAVLIELKQWEDASAIEGTDALVETFTGGGVRTVVHPSYQAWSYAAMITDYNASVQDMGIAIRPCAFLHNYTLRENDPILYPQYQTYIKDAPLFTRGQTAELQKFIRENICKGDGGQVIRTIDGSEIRPSKSLQDAIGGMLDGNREFIMLDDQKVVFEKILEAACMSRSDGWKRTVIVEGGPGTGKSVIAVNLLARLTQAGQYVQYVSKNSAPRTVYAKKLKGRMTKSSVDNMFKGSGIYTQSQLNEVDTVLVDEAHRLNAKSGVYQNLGENQIKELIHAAKCSVFFIDESQRVTMSDIGSIPEIEDRADEEGSEVIRMELVSQFRCNGSDAYLSWLDDVLQIRSTANHTLAGTDYDFRVLDDPNEVRRLIVERNESDGRSRMLAGYCWNWLKNGQNDTGVHDIVIGDFAMSWNLGNSIFAIDDTSINEVGCIHTSQGLEFSYAGVIIGPDLICRDGRLITDFNARAKTDQSMRGIKKLYAEDPAYALTRAEEIIKNTYRTLMTRGMKGCYVYCVDRELGEYLKSRLGR